MTNVKQLVTDRKIFIDYGDVFGVTEKHPKIKIEDIKQNLDRIHKKYSLRKAVDYDLSVSHYGYDGGSQLELTVYRYETDLEYEKRLEVLEKKLIQEEKARLKTEEHERKEYLRLKKKYEAKV